MATSQPLPDSSSRLTKAMLQTAIANQLQVNKNCVVVDSFQLTVGSSPGDGFATDMKSVDVKASVNKESHELNYIAKLSPTDAMRRHVQEKGLFKREACFYEQMAGNMEKARTEANLPEMRLAKCYFASAEKGVLIMENLKTLGFQVPQKSCKGLNADSFEGVVTALAQFHATGYHLIQSHPGGAQAFLQEKPSFVYMSTYEWLPLESITDIFRILVSILKHSAGRRTDLADKLLDQLEVWQEKAEASCRPKPGALSTFAHGDSWYSNVLIKFKKDGSVDNIATIDFQTAQVSNPGPDLAHLFHSSTFPAERRIHEDRWLNLYHATFAKNIEAFGYPTNTYPVEQVKKDYQHAGYHGFAISLLHMVLLLAKPGSEVGKMMVPSSEENKDDGPDNMVDMVKEMAGAIVKEAENAPFFMDRLIGILELADEGGLI